MTIGAMVPQTGLKGTGVLVPVVGPDSARIARLIASASQVYSQNRAVVFSAPVITGTKHGTGVSSSEFSALDAAGAFAASWSDNDGSHGLPVSIFDDLTAGRVVVTSVARPVIPQLRRRHARVHVIYLTDQRRSAGAKGPADRDVRWLARISGPPESGLEVDIPEPPVTVIDISGPLSEAVEEFLGVLESYVPMSE